MPVLFFVLALAVSWRLITQQERINDTMATQADVDAISNELQSTYDAIHSKLDDLNSEIAKLLSDQNNGNGIDVTPLKAIADNLKALVPTAPPGIPVTPEPAPGDSGSSGSTGDASSSGDAGSSASTGDESSSGETV